MDLRRYVVELGVGTDLHGQDVTKAAVKAVRDAVSRSSLCGLREVLHLSDLNDMVVKVRIAAPDPEPVRTEEVLAQILFGRKEIEVIKGGMELEGMSVPELGNSGDRILVVNAGVTVYVDLERLNFRQKP